MTTPLTTTIATSTTTTTTIQLRPQSTTTITTSTTTVTTTTITTTTLSTTHYINPNGCEFDPSAPMFHQDEDTSSIINDWTWNIRYQRIVDNDVGWPTYNWMPDGHISTIWDNETGYWYTFYPNHESYRTRAVETPLPDFAEELNPTHKVG